MASDVGGAGTPPVLDHNDSRSWRSSRLLYCRISIHVVSAQGQPDVETQLIVVGRAREVLPEGRSVVVAEGIRSPVGVVLDRDGTLLLGAWGDGNCGGSSSDVLGPAPDRHRRFDPRKRMLRVHPVMSQKC